MATRKKKTVKKIITQAETESAYKGSVTIKLMRGKHVYKTMRGLNSGELPLFNYIASCLASNYIDSLAPRYIVAFNNQLSTFDSTSPTTTSPIRFSTVSVDESTASASLTFVIPGSVFTFDASTNMFALYSSKNASNKAYSSPSAWLKLDTAITDVGVGDNVAVIWKLTVSNK